MSIYENKEVDRKLTQSGLLLALAEIKGFQARLRSALVASRGSSNSGNPSVVNESCLPGLDLIVLSAL